MSRLPARRVARQDVAQSPSNGCVALGWHCPSLCEWAGGQRSQPLCAPWQSHAGWTGWGLAAERVEPGCGRSRGANLRSTRALRVRGSSLRHLLVVEGLRRSRVIRLGAVDRRDGLRGRSAPRTSRKCIRPRRARMAALRALWLPASRSRRTDRSRPTSASSRVRLAVVFVLHGTSVALWLANAEHRNLTWRWRIRNRHSVQRPLMV